MAVRKVASMGHPVLRQVAAPVPENEITSPAIQALLHDMLETMVEYDGRGLAAPQVHESLQVVVMVWDFDEDPEGNGKGAKVLFLINPVLKTLTQETSSFWEGCLSVPGLRGLVARPNRVSVTALDQKGKKIEFVAEGFAATVIQHECDHLLGKLYIDRMTDLTKLAFNREYQKYLSEESPEDVDGDSDGE